MIWFWQFIYYPWIFSNSTFKLQIEVSKMSKIKSIFKCQMCWFYSKWPLTNYTPHGYSGPFCFHYMLGCLGVTPGNIHCHCISSTLQVCLGVQPLQLKVPPALSLLQGFSSFKVHQSHGNVFKMWIPGPDTRQILSKQEMGICICNKSPGWFWYRWS